MSLLSASNEYAVNLCQLLATSVSCCLFVLSGLYQIYKKFWSSPTRHFINIRTNDDSTEKNSSSNEIRKSINTLFNFHNLRSSLEIILLVISSLELCRSLLPFTRQELMQLTENDELKKLLQHNQNNYYQKLFIYTSPFNVANSIIGICMSLILIGFHRVLEICNAPDYLYLSSTLELLLALIRLYKINSELSIADLELFFNYSFGVVLFSLAVIDGFTIYGKTLKPKTKIDSPKDQEQIGYKHTTSTFLSKMTFWWLNPLLWHGYQEPLEQEDLGCLREEDSAKANYDHFLLIYKTACTRQKNPSLWLCYLKSSWKWFTLGGLLKLFGDMTALIGPLSIHQIVEFIETQYNDSISTSAQLLASKNSTNFYQILYKHSIFNETYSLHSKHFDSSLLTYVDGQLYRLNGHSSGNLIFYYYPNWTEFLSNGWIIAWIVLVSSIAQGGLSQSSTHLLNMTGIRIKTSLQGLIYRKTLLLSSSCFERNSDVNDLGDVKREGTEYIRKFSSSGGNNTTSGQGDSSHGRRDAGSITNLMSEDALNIMSFFWISHYVWAIPLKIGIVMYLLYLKLGISAIIGSLVCIFTMTPLQFLIGKAMSKNSEKSAQCTDERLKRTNDIFMGIKIIKLNAWEKVFKEKIMLARKNELKYLNKDSFYWTIMTFLTHVSSVLITFVTLAFYVKLENNDDDDNDDGSNLFNNPEFTASRLFSALALFNQLTVPLLIFPITVPIIISAIVSTRRLESFLSEPEVQKEFEGIRNMARILSKSDASLDMYENDRRISFNPKCNYENDDDDSLSQIIPLSILPSSMAIENSKVEMIRKCKNDENEHPSITNPNQSYKRQYSLDENGERIELMTQNHDNNSNLSHNKMPRKVKNNKTDLNVKIKLEPTTKLIKSTDSNDCDDDDDVQNIDEYSTMPSIANVKVKLRREYNSNVLSKNRNLLNCNSGSSSGTSISTIPTVNPVGGVGGIKSRKIITTGSSRKDSLKFQTENSIAVSIENAIFSWDNYSTNSPLLRINKIDIPKGKLTVIVGKSGSGKSSILAALLKEMQQISGDIAWNKYATIAYVPQMPWLLNSNIRENILFGESYRPKRYEKVLEACALKPDIELMPDGDQTIIGERGINLSGGQKQRIVIARSLYSSANVVIMDDPLSSLDNEVAKHVFENSIRKMLLKASRTVVLVTQRLQLVYNADYIIVMKDNYVQSAGSYNEIVQNHQDVIGEWNLIMENGTDKDQISPGKTARERWRLFKNISRIGLLQRPQEMEQENMLSIYLVGLKVKLKLIEILEKRNSDNIIADTQSLYMNSKRRSSIFGSRHLIYDIPLPIDECQNDDIFIKRRNSTSRRSLFMMMNLLSNNNSTLSSSTSEIHNQNRSGTDIGDNTRIYNKKNILRVNSLQPENRCDNVRAPVVRNISSPGRFNDSKNRILENELKTKSGFRQFLYRMSSRKSNVGSRLHRTISASNSIQSITEECHQALNRNESSSSECIDDESVHDLNDDNNCNKFYDEERKYGEIPLQIYMLYLKSCGLSIVLIFFLTALIWQCLRVYTDVWLRNWTEIFSNNYNNNHHNDVDNDNNYHKFYDVQHYFNIYAIISCICICMSLISTPAGQIAGCNAREILHKQLINSILQKPLYFFQITPLGKILNRFSNDMAIIDKKIASTSQRLLQFTLLCLFAILINLAITPWFIVFTIPICFAYYIIQKFYRCSSRELQRLENITNSPVISHFNETIQGVTTIRAYSQESRFTETLFKKLEANTIAFVILNTSNRWLGIALDYLGGVIVFLAIVTALVASTIASNEQKNLLSNGNDNSMKSFTFKEQQHQQQHDENNHHLQSTLSPSPSLVGLAINYTLLIPIYLNWVVKLLADMEMYVGSVERVAYYQQKVSNNMKNYKTDADADDDDDDNGDDNKKINNNNSNTNDNDNDDRSKNILCCRGENNCHNEMDLIGCSSGGGGVGIPCIGKNVDTVFPITENEHCRIYKNVSISWPQKGDIIFENVSLRYQGQKQNVINDLSLRIPAGQRIGICGRTGSGKSSLALSLFSVLDVVNGKILIDDVDITKIHPDETRSRLSIIPQDAHLFNATIRDNLDPRGYFSDLELWNCLEMSQLKDIVNKMPMRLDTEIVEGGLNLSAGQRQLFCLARAVLRGSVCLVLDEATSSLDTITEQSLMDAAHNAFKGRTILTIAHRLSTLLSYDRIIVLENGKIIEDGRPIDLQNISNGKFVNMLNSGNS